MGRTRVAPPCLEPLPVGMSLVMRAQLLPLEGGSPLTLIKDLTLVGRKEDCDLRIDHKSVSKMHCVLVKTDGLLLVRDLGSTNGTRVNGTRVRRAILLPNDQIAIAGFKFKVQLGPDVPEAGQHEHTQHLDQKDVAKLMRRPGMTEEADSSIEISAPPVVPNALPDVYPDEKEEK